MFNNIKIILFISIFLIITILCNKANNNNQDNLNKEIEKKIYKIVIVMDTMDDWSTEISNGFKDTINKLLTSYKATVKYKIFDTELKQQKTIDILNYIMSNTPDLICTINYPTAFADKMISQKLKDSKYKIVSENCIPVQSNTINSWENPGGNITGVGVFVNLKSPIRLMKKLNPDIKNLVFYSWDQMVEINKWFYQELLQACKDEKINLVEFRKIPHHEANYKFFSDYNKRKNFFCMPGISAYKHKSGQKVKNASLTVWQRKNNYLPTISYEESEVKNGNLAGTCVMWYDIGTQLAEKGIQILKGKNPGEIPWDYPRKYNIIINLKRAKFLNIKIPSEILNAAYRIYTDYNGNYLKKNNLLKE